MKKYSIKFRKQYFLYFYLILFSTVGCKKEWLEEKPDKSLLVPSNLDDLRGLLNNFNYMNLQYPSLGEIASGEFYVTDAVVQNAISTNFIRRDAYKWSKTVPHVVVTDWNNSYQKILIDNIVLESLNKIIPHDEAEVTAWNTIKGQALFNRARVFFELAQLYAPPYSPLTADHDLGIVLKLVSDITAKSERSSLKATYEQILKDLIAAMALLPGRPQYLSQGSASAAAALMARVYLSMSDYENAYLAADNSLKLYDKLLDYNDVSATANFIGLYNKEVLSHTNSGGLFASLSAILIEPSFYDLYDQNDLRKTRFYRKNANGTITFKGNYDSRNDAAFNGIATDEIYLTRAECHARAGRTSDALKDLNALLIKRWNKNVVYPIITAASANEALRIILSERRKELILRGTRWTDLRRLNKDPNFAITLKRMIASVEYTLEPNSPKYTFPIPDDIIEQTGLKQNPGWQ